jgi:ribosomal protein S27AE
MAIKIIKQGKLLKSPVRFICPRCGCVFNADGESLSFDPNDNGRFPKLVARAECPTCGRCVVLREWELDHE